MEDYIEKKDLYLFITDYLGEGKVFHEIFTSSDYMLQRCVTKYFEDCEKRKVDDVLPEIIRSLESLGYLSESRYNQVCIIKEVAARHAGVDVVDIFGLLFSTYREFLWSDTAGGILFNHYGEIIRVIMEKYIYSNVDAEQFIKDVLPEALSRCIMNNLDSCVIIAYRGEEEIRIHDSSGETVTDDETYEDTTEDEEEEIEDEYLKESRFLHCYIVPSGDGKPACFLSSDGVFEIPVDLIIDDDVRTEDLVTFVDDNNGEAATFQVMGKIEAENDTDTTAYKAISLPYPILREEDVKQYMDLKSGNIKI